MQGANGTSLFQDTVALRERAKYMRMWERPEYHRYSPGAAHAPRALAALGMKPGETLYDLGCGNCQAVPIFAAHGLIVRAADIAMTPALAAWAMEKTKHLPTERLPLFTGVCLWSIPMNWPPRDYVFCCDVLEHIPPGHVDSVLLHMKRLTGKAGYLNIHCAPDGCGKLIGETLHLTVERPEWWMAKLGAHFLVERHEAPPSELTCVIRPKPETAHAQ